MIDKLKGPKAVAMEAAVERWPVLNAALNKIEATSHALELKDGRYAHFKYLEAIYQFYCNSKEKGKRKRDKARICKLRGLQIRKDVCLFGALILATTGISKSTRSKYVNQLQQAVAADVAPADIRIFLRRPKKGAVRQRRAIPRPPTLRLIQANR